MQLFEFSHLNATQILALMIFMMSQGVSPQKVAFAFAFAFRLCSNYLIQVCTTKYVSGQSVRHHGQRMDTDEHVLCKQQNSYVG